MDVRVVLDELILEGVRPGDPLVTEAIERALADALPSAARDVSPRAVAAQVADAVQTETSR